MDPFVWLLMSAFSPILLFRLLLVRILIIGETFQRCFVFTFVIDRVKLVLIGC